ncbi:MAG: hypothetical protein Q9170_005071 [Blastenia crenularia]
MPNIAVNTRSRKLLAKLLKGPTQFVLADAARGGEPYIKANHQSDQDADQNHPRMHLEPGTVGLEDQPQSKENIKGKGRLVRLTELRSKVDDRDGMCKEEKE